MLRNVTGNEPATCPWRAFADPVCADVINASKWFESGQVGVVLGADPPAHLVHGIEVYQSAASAARADAMDRRRKQRKATAK